MQCVGEAKGGGHGGTWGPWGAMEAVGTMG